MNYQREIRTLTAEMLAIERVISHVLERISRLDPLLAAAIRAGVEDAARDIEDLATKFGKTASSERAVKAIAIVERLRAAERGGETVRRGTSKLRASIRSTRH